jgi:alpha 1,2-mannosyltransferase
MNPAIVYLAQNTNKDPLWGRCSKRSVLDKSLDLLFENYNNKFKHPVLIFHEGDFKQNDQEEVAKGRKEIQFREIHFEIPLFLKKEEIPEKWGDLYGIGYRHMLRFYALLVYDILEKLGYDWILRMDDDSFIHSKIDYNLFEFMEKNGYEYGYRVDMREDRWCLQGFGESVLAYIESEQIKPTFFYEYLDYPFKATLKNYMKAILMKLNPNKECKLELMPHYNCRGYYNNFFITKISFWKSPQVQSFLHYIDRIGGGYKYRWGDHSQQSAAVQIFMRKEKVYKFTDWTYEHISFWKDGTFGFGGIFEGDNDKNSEKVKEFIRLYGRAHDSKNTH